MVPSLSCELIEKYLKIFGAIKNHICLKTFCEAQLISLICQLEYIVEFHENELEIHLFPSFEKDFNVFINFF